MGNSEIAGSLSGKRRLLTSSFSLNVPYGISFIVTFVTLPLILKGLNKESYGLFVFALAVEEWVSSISGLNITAGMKRGLAHSLDGTFVYALLRRWLILILVGMLLGVSSFFTVLVLKKATLGYLLLIMAIYAMTGVLFRPLLLEFFAAKKLFYQLAFWKTLMTSIPAVGSALVALSSGDVLFFALFQLGSMTLISFVGCIYIMRKYSLVKAYRLQKVDTTCFSYGLRMIPADFTSLLAFKLSHFIIGPFLGFAELAVFSVASGFRDKVSEMMKNVRTLVYSDFASMHEKQIIRKISNKLFLLLVVSLLITLGIISAVTFYVKLFLPTEFALSISYFIVLSLSFPASLIDIVLQTMFESHLRHRELIIRRVSSDLLRIAMIFVMGYFFGVMGICAAISVSMWVGVSICYYLTKKLLKENNERLAIGYEHS